MRMDLVIKPIYYMKKLIQIPLLFIAITLIFNSCDKISEYKAEADGKKLGELFCQVFENINDEELLKEAEELGSELDKQYGKYGYASDENKLAFEKALEGTMKDCN